MSYMSALRRMINLVNKWTTWSKTDWVNLSSSNKRRARRRTRILGLQIRAPIVGIARFWNPSRNLNSRGGSGRSSPAALDLPTRSLIWYPTPLTLTQECWWSSRAAVLSVGNRHGRELLRRNLRLMNKICLGMCKRPSRISTHCTSRRVSRTRCARMRMNSRSPCSRSSIRRRASLNNPWLRRKRMSMIMAIDRATLNMMILWRALGRSSSSRVELQMLNLWVV